MDPPSESRLDDLNTATPNLLDKLLWEMDPTGTDI